ncbi:MAG: Hsp20/alpha crystallin family protein [Planctomycetota bacterium]|jgi:HSP20 family protein
MAVTPPFGASFEKLRQELDTLLESAWSNGEKALDRFGLRTGAGTFEPFVDLIETEENIVVTVDVPGLEASGVDVSLIGNMLTLRGERLPVLVGEGDKRHVNELRCGKFTRSIPLPVAVDPEKVSATARNGVLTIHLGKQHVAKPRQIPVNVS